jgi:hypothetical protein
MADGGIVCRVSRSVTSGPCGHGERLLAAETKRTALQNSTHQAKGDVFGHGGSTTPFGVISDISALLSSSAGEKTLTAKQVASIRRLLAAPANALELLIEQPVSFF